MTVEELIEELKKMPPEDKVYSHHYNSDVFFKVDKIKSQEAYGGGRIVLLCPY